MSTPFIAQRTGNGFTFGDTVAVRLLGTYYSITRQQGDTLEQMLLRFILLPDDFPLREEGNPEITSVWKLRQMMRTPALDGESRVITQGYFPHRDSGVGLIPPDDELAAKGWVNRCLSWEGVRPPLPLQAMGMVSITCTGDAGVRMVKLLLHRTEGVETCEVCLRWEVSSWKADFIQIGKDEFRRTTDYEFERVA